MRFWRNGTVELDFALGRVVYGNLDGVAMLHLNDILAHDDLRAFCGIGIGGCGVGTCDLNGIGDLQNAIAGRDDNAVAEHRFCFFCISHLVKRETVLVVLREENRIAGKSRSKGAANDIRKNAFLACVQVLFNQVENVVSVACEDNLVVVDPGDIAFVVTGCADDFKILAVGIDDGNSALDIVKEAECDSLSVGAEFWTVDVVVEV